MEQSLQTEYVSYPSTEHDVRAYLATPPGAGPWPALIVIHEWTGLIPYVEDVSRRLTREGYLALAPDLYSGDPERASFEYDDMEEAGELNRAPDIEEALRKHTPERGALLRRIHEWRQARSGRTYIPDLQATMTYLQRRTDVVASRIGVIGFCMGGRLSGTLATTGAELAAASIFYGPIPPLDGVPDIRCPMEGHYGSADPSVTSRVPQLDAAMKAAGKDFTYFVYEGAPHAFHNDTRPSYTADAAELSWARTLEFLNRHVKRAVAAGR